MSHELKTTRPSLVAAWEAVKPKPLAEVTGDMPDINGDELMSEVIDFIGRYLHCSEHQRIVLALWIFHTYCLSAATTTPYLAIRSHHKQSGKTLCLHLLSLLCNDPAFSSGFTAATLTRRNEPVIHTLLLDEFQATIGTRSRCKNPLLRALLVSGSRVGPGYTDHTHERNLFCPKAFAGIGALPEMLADRSIPFLLEPIGSRPSGSPMRDAFPRSGVEVSSAAHQKIQRFNSHRASEHAGSLRQLLYFWSLEHETTLEEMPSLNPEQFPPGLSPRRQDMIEPLLQIAGLIGSEWPRRSREALAALFEQEIVHDHKDSLQLLSDLREAFNHNGNPQRISTAALLDWLHTQPHRPWNQEGPITAQTLAAMLQPFGIRSRTQRVGKASPARGYLMPDFVACWFKLLPPEPRFNDDGSPRQPITKPNEYEGCSNVAPGEKDSKPEAKKAATGAEDHREIIWGTGSLSTVQQIPGARMGPIMIQK